MPPIIITIATAIFRWVFKTTKKAAKDAKSDIGIAVSVLAKTGGKNLRKFLAAVPTMVLFIRELIRQRGRIETQSEWLILGAGAAMTGFITFVIVGTLAALPVQLALVVSLPLLGIPLIASTGASLVAITVFLVWAIIFALNSAFQCNPVFIEIQEKFLKGENYEMLDKMTKEIKSKGANVERLNETIHDALIASGERAGKSLQKVGQLDARLTKLSESILFDIIKIKEAANDPIRSGSDIEK